MVKSTASSFVSDNSSVKPSHADQPGTGVQVRVVATRTVDKVLHKGQSLDSLMEQAYAAVPAKDRGLLTHLVQGVLRWYRPLQAQIEQHLHAPLRSADQILMPLMCIGLYQSKHLHHPDYVVVDTTVNAVKALKKPKAVGLVNAVMRQAIAADLTLIAGVGTHPAWLEAMITERTQSAERTGSILAANDDEPRTWVRLRSDRREAVLSECERLGAPLWYVPEVTNAYLLPDEISVQQALSLGNEAITVQDVSAQVLGLFIRAIADQLPASAQVLDACSAPGGKAALIASEWPQWSVLGVDKSAMRLDRMRENIQSWQIDIALEQADLMDASADFYAADRVFDLIVLDAPCSAIGVIRRHPDIKHLRAPKGIARAAEQQRQILYNLWSQLAPGGFLIYATCSYLVQETDAVLADFLQAHSAQCHWIDASFLQRTAYGAIIYPDQTILASDGTQSLALKMDGFYYALLEKPS